jgi:hypothetical protein
MIVGLAIMVQKMLHSLMHRTSCVVVLALFSSLVISQDVPREVSMLERAASSLEDDYGKVLDDFFNNPTCPAPSPGTGSGKPYLMNDGFRNCVY